MKVWLVTPAWRRYHVTDLVLQQHRLLARSLATFGVTARRLVIADDDNLEIARDHGCDILSMGGTLGARVNAGFAAAREAGADWVCFTGSDNWLHPALFLDLPDDAVVTGRSCSVVDLERGVLFTVAERGEMGAAPWLIPAAVLERCDWRPVDRDDRTRGMEIGMRVGMGRVSREYRDPCPHARVDFKSEDSMTGYEVLRRVPGLATSGEVDAWEALLPYYPSRLVLAARHAKEGACTVVGSR